jgi:hypothetical protein
LYDLFGDREFIAFKFSPHHLRITRVLYEPEPN